mgnify:FL=1
MRFKKGDRVIFPNDNYFTLRKPPIFTKHKEYIIESIGGDSSGEYYRINNDEGLLFNINEKYLHIAPVYQRNKTIDEILL